MLNDFYISEIDDEIFSRIRGKSYKEDCFLPREELRYLHVMHKDLNGKIFPGELICNVYIVAALLDIFQKLYAADYPIEKIRLIDEYDADDEKSMADNNSSCFNFRVVAGTKRISLHALGLAVDINPLYNPYITFSGGKKNIAPANSADFEDREKNFPFKIDDDDFCKKLFTEHGFIWGGDWTDCKDYQHFALPDDIVAKLYPGVR